MRIHVSILIVFSALVARLSFSSLSLVQHFHLIWLFDIGKGNWNYFAAIRNEKRNPKLEATHLEKAKELYTRVWFSGYSISFWLLCFAIFLDHFLISFCLNGTFCTFFFPPNYTSAFAQQLFYVGVCCSYENSINILHLIKSSSIGNLLVCITKLMVVLNCWLGL